MNINTLKLETKFYDLDIGTKTIKFRKWKNKDRQEYKTKILELDKNNPKYLEEVSKITLKCLVLNCLDKEYALSADEMQYILIKIRAKSIGETSKFKYNCEKCGTENIRDLNLNDFKFKFKNINIIESENLKLELCEVMNTKLYNDTIISGGNLLQDLILRIKSVNSDESFSKKDLEDLFDELETDELDFILEQFKERFLLIRDIEFSCSECQHAQDLNFDTIPDFIPSKWFE